MRRTLLALSVATALTAVPTLAHAQELTFTQKEIGAGTTIDQRTVMSFDMDMKMTMPDGNGMDMKMAMEDVEDKTVTIVAADTQGPSRITVHYDERAEKQTMFGNVQAKPSPVAGKTYTLTRSPGGLQVDPVAQGAALEELQGELGQLDDLRGFVQNLGKSSIPIGQEVDLAALQNSGLLGATPANGAKMEKGTLTLTESRTIDGRPHGVFDLDMRMVGQDPSTGMQMVMDMDGEVVIDTTTGWMRSMNFTGPMSMTGSTTENGVEMKMAANGTFSMKTDVGYKQ